MKQGYIMQLINTLFVSQKTDKGKKNDSVLHRCQNQMRPSSYYLHVDTSISHHRYDRIVYSDLSTYLV
jgi:hypothetical protein